MYEPLLAPFFGWVGASSDGLAPVFLNLLPCRCGREDGAPTEEILAWFVDRNLLPPGSVFNVMAEYNATS